MISTKTFITDLFFPFSILTLTTIAYNLNIQALNDISFYLLSFGGFYTIIKGFSKKLAIKQVFLTTDNKLISGNMKPVYHRNKYLQYFLFLLGETNVYSDIAYYSQDEVVNIPVGTTEDRSTNKYYDGTSKKNKKELKNTEYKIGDIFTESNIYV